MSKSHDGVAKWLSSPSLHCGCTQIHLHNMVFPFTPACPSFSKWSNLPFEIMPFSCPTDPFTQTIQDSSSIPSFLFHERLWDSLNFSLFPVIPQLFLSIFPDQIKIIRQITDIHLTLSSFQFLICNGNGDLLFHQRMGNMSRLLLIVVSSKFSAHTFYKRWIHDSVFPNLTHLQSVPLTSVTCFFFLSTCPHRKLQT